jgi:hypothetical protein
MANVPAPQLAIDYYGMSANAKLADLIKHVRADEQHHSEVNHRYADGDSQGTQLVMKDNANNTAEMAIQKNVCCSQDSI